jgi:hypothetical protein
MVNSAKELREMNEESKKLEKELKELDVLGKQLAKNYAEEEKIAHLKGLSERMLACLSKQKEAGKFSEKIMEESNVDGVTDFEINDAAKKQFKKIMEQIDSFHCAETEKALSGSLQKAKKRYSPFTNALAESENDNNRKATAPGPGGSLRRKRHSKKSRKRRTKCGRRKTKCQRRSRRKNTRKRRKKTKRRH